jgi:two-component system cell cycle response regulator
VTLRWRLTLGFVLVVVLPLVVGLLLLARGLPKAVQARQEVDAVSQARLLSQVFQDFCERAKTTAELAGRDGALANAAEARAVAASSVKRGLADGISLAGPNGGIFFSVGRLPDNPVDCANSLRGSREPFISAIVRLTTSRGQVAGEAVASFELSPTLLGKLSLALPEGDIVLVSPEGTAVASSEPFDDDVIEDAINGRRPPGLVSGFARAGSQSLGVLVLAPAAQGPPLLVAGGLIIVVAVLAAFMIAVVSARATTRPLAELGDAATRIAGGDLSTRIEVRSRDEVGRLATAFNDMTEDLRGYIEELQASRDELQSGLARLGDTLSSTHDLDRILHVVLESAMASTRAGGGMVMMLSRDRKSLTVAASKGIKVAPDLTLKMGEGVSGRAARSGDPIRGRLGTGAGELKPGPGEPSGPSVIAVPLKSSGTVIGVLDLFGSAKAQGFDDRDLATIRTFASQATVAVDNVLLHEEAQRVSITDDLTGLYNYRYFSAALSKEIERAARFGRPLSLLMLDLDRFKDVNDTYGHQRGDEVLAEVASRVLRKVRDVDTVCRYGGEEFVVILPETDEAGACKLAERIAQAMRRKGFVSEGYPQLQVTVSVGVAVFPQHGASPGVLLRHADRALYAAKAAGRDTWRLASSGATDD